MPWRRKVSTNRRPYWDSQHKQTQTHTRINGVGSIEFFRMRHADSKNVPNKNHTQLDKTSTYQKLQSRNTCTHKRFSTEEIPSHTFSAFPRTGLISKAYSREREDTKNTCRVKRYIIIVFRLKKTFSTWDTETNTIAWLEIGFNNLSQIGPMSTWEKWALNPSGACRDRAGRSAEKILCQRNHWGAHSGDSTFHVFPEEEWTENVWKMLPLCACWCLWDLPEDNVISPEVVDPRHTKKRIVGLEEEVERGIWVLELLSS